MRETISTIYVEMIFLLFLLYVVEKKSEVRCWTLIIASPVRGIANLEGCCHHGWNSEIRAKEERDRDTEAGCFVPSDLLWQVVLSSLGQPGHGP